MLPTLNVVQRVQGAYACQTDVSGYVLFLNRAATAPASPLTSRMAAFKLRRAGENAATLAILQPAHTRLTQESTAEQGLPFLLPCAC